MKILLLFFVLGCLAVETSPPIEQTIEGVTILNLNLEDAQIKSGSTTRLHVQVQATGASKATNVDVNVIGGGLLISKQSPTTSFDLLAPNPSLEIPGEVVDAIFTITAPERILSKTTRILKARVTYDYESKTKKEVPILKTSRRQELKKLGPLPKGAEIKSNAPIQIEILTPTLVDVPDDASSVTFDFDVSLKNIGTGMVKSNACPNQPLNCIDSIEIFLEGGKSLTCDGVTSSATIEKKIKVKGEYECYGQVNQRDGSHQCWGFEYDDHKGTCVLPIKMSCKSVPKPRRHVCTTNDKEVEADCTLINPDPAKVTLSSKHLWKGKELRIPCKGEVSMAKEEEGTYNELYPPIHASAKYTYRIEKETILEIIP
jgi:hypothetical protein